MSSTKVFTSQLEADMSQGINESIGSFHVPAIFYKVGLLAH